MKIPASTYRIQFSSDFTFADFREIIGYLEDLGITTIYASPIFQARKGSTHGYDVVDSSRINPEIGKQDEFEEIQDILKEKGMSWLQDIVPNHMAYSPENRWIWDMLEFGSESDYHQFYDVNWDYENWQKILLPVLGSSVEEVIKKGELKINLTAAGFSLKYYNNQYPASDSSYPTILELAGFDDWKQKFLDFTGDRKEWMALKLDLNSKLKDNNKLKSFFTSVKKNASQMQRILEKQNFKLVHWQHTENEINYRRFFTINDLICLKMENDKVFTAYHSFIHEMVDKGDFTGLRIDHIDGLYDPKQYLENLSKLMGDVYVVVEKILEWDENIPDDWDCEGTSGYEFLAEANHLFTDSTKAEEFSQGYHEIYPRQKEYEDLVYQKKLYILKQRMGGELHNLLKLIEELGLFKFSDSETLEKYRTNLSLVLAGFSVYRIYPEKFPLNDSETEVVEKAFSNASTRKEANPEILEELKKIFLGTGNLPEDKTLPVLKRIQQFTGPLAAKGVEDTSFYIFNRLISHNEVGDSPEHFGISVENFHSRMKKRFINFPHSINTTATHDTKRGEDARMRLNVLSEIPREWFSKIKEWREMNLQFKNEKNVPDSNEEYFIYQALIGAWNFEEETEDFIERTRDYLEKVLREAKVHSSWSDPDEDYEDAIFDFISSIIKSSNFKKSFVPFVKKIAYFGVIKSLAQVALKCTAPGIPDVYQGSELWDLSYVDPDNRRPVDYELIKKYLSKLKSIKSIYLNNSFNDLKSNYTSGEIKLASLNSILKFRKAHHLLFEKGEYIPIKLSGEDCGELVAFARKYEGETLVCILPVLVTNLFEDKNFTFHNKSLKISSETDENSNFENIFTGKKYTLKQENLIFENLNDFPIAVLTNIF